jgi:hypothetical protein
VALFFSKAASNLDLTLKATEEKFLAGKCELRTLLRNVEVEAIIYGATLEAAEFSIF